MVTLRSRAFVGVTRDKNMRVLLTATAFAIGTVSQVAGAEDGIGMYVGAGVGQISVNGQDGNATGYKLFVGTNFNRYVGIEAAYIDAGYQSVTAYDPYSGSTAYGDSKVSAAQLSVLGRIPVSRYFALFGRVDGIFWRDDVNVVAYDYYGNTYEGSESQFGAAFGWGAGGEALLGHFALRAEFEQSRINAYTYGLISGSLIYRF
jgi:Outer membrane protein beta-barrel domain